MGYLPEEVIFSKEKLVTIDKNKVIFLKQKAMKNRRTRIRLCAHLSIKDPVHEMIIVHVKGNYILPHKHINKSESFYVIEGTAELFFFDDKGNITKVVSLGEYNTGEIFYYRSVGVVYHTLVVTSDTFIIHETTKGPFVRTETVFAKWAPPENDIEAGGKYMENLLEQKKKLDKAGPRIL